MPSAVLAALGDRYLNLAMSGDPFEATMLGVPGYDHLVPDVSDAATDARVHGMDDVVSAARALTDLDPADDITRAVLIEEASSRSSIAAQRATQFQTAPFQASVHSLILGTVAKVNLTSTDAAAAYLERLHGLPSYIDGAIDQLRAGRGRGRTTAARSAQASIRALDGYLAGAVADDVLLTPTWSDAEWRDGVTSAVRDEVRPAFARLRDCYADLVGTARPDDKVGLSWLPNGDATYAAFARAHTTTTLTPEEMHELGMHELARLDDEYAAMGQKLFGVSDVDEIIARMRHDPSLRLRDRDDLLRRSRLALDKAEAALPKWFGLMPPSACAFEVVPAVEQDSSAPAYYMPPDPASGRAGTYWVNTYKVEQRPVFDVQAMTFHEALPGHHLQVSIAAQLDSLPLFRRLSLSGAYTEGWGLYAERLADEMGLYDSDLDRLGMLSCDAWRACRLVVDTGMHALGWSFQRSVDFMAKHCPLGLSVIEPEVDRYIGMPGQALCYMVGRLEIDRLRREAEAALGDGFAIRDFHDAVIASGALPLRVLQESIVSWVRDTAGQAQPA